MTISYISISANKWIEYNDTNDAVKIVNRAELRTQKQAMADRLASLPVINNAYKIAWFDQHYDQMDIVRERVMLEAEIAKIKAILQGTGGE